jgi:hypothetical protein
MWRARHVISDRRIMLMDRQKSNPTFEARRLQSARGWYVRVAWSDGRCHHVPGFVTHTEATRWIEQKAPVWLSENSTSVLSLIARSRDFGQPALADQWIVSV